MATVNIGTNKGNIVGVKTKKPFRLFTANDAYEIAVEKYGKGVQLIGFAKVYPKRKKK